MSGRLGGQRGAFACAAEQAQAVCTLHIKRGSHLLCIPLALSSRREEFTNYMFLERAQEASGSTNENWRLFPQDFKDRNDPGVSHRGDRLKIFAWA